MIQKVHKFGNSLAIVIPSSANKRRKLRPGSMVEVAEMPDGWLIRPVAVVPALAADVKEIADDLAESRAGVYTALAE
jgi:antitoxin component of MazEF toxin-antitoxin module